MRAVKVAVFKRRWHWRVECSVPGCLPWLRNLRFASHASACSFAGGHVSDHSALRDAVTRAHAVTRMPDARCGSSIDCAWGCPGCGPR